MSASSYAACPRCLRRAKEARAADLAAAAASYGKVDEATYLEAVNSVPDVNRADYFTFAEYHEVYGADLGTVKVSYGGSCEKCGLTLEFAHEHAIPGALSDDEEAGS